MKIISIILMVLLISVGVSAQTIWKSPWFIIINGKNITLDGKLLQVGDSIKCYSPRGVYCGVGEMQPYQTYSNNILMSTPIYGEDPWQSGDNGIRLKDTVKFVITYKVPQAASVVWKSVTATSVLRDGMPNFVVAKEWSTFQELYAFKSQSCCIKKGDIDGDGNIDIADLTQLIMYMQLLAPLNCFDAADIDNDGNVDIADLTRFIDFLFINFTPLGECVRPISWTAPYDPQDGKAFMYDIRYADNLNTLKSWETASKISSIPTPSESGFTDFALVPASYGSTVYVGLKSADQNMNWSNISNILIIK